MRQGRVEVIAGPMFAGKSEELLRRVRRAVIAGRRVEVFTHRLDVRRGAGLISSHAGAGHPARPAATAAEIVSMADPAAELVAVDEAQFFGPDLAEVADRLAVGGAVVVVAGLDVTFDRRPFEPMPSLTALAESVTKLTSICLVCGNDAIFHERVEQPCGSATDVVAEHVGGEDKYQARCRVHVRR
ncbi:thymidine kinase [Nonomuraea sp. NPDC050790]|uniref:thymidine kinase n=1 Tax=Nonomuraea sp. NPDC050790 TaxID=3364371 RepID=UPI0037A73224